MSESEGNGSDASSDESWITWFCKLPGNEMLCEIEESFINDNFNLYGLAATIPQYDQALDLILDIANKDIDQIDDNTTEGHEKTSRIEAAAEALYGLIHARYILSSRGMHKMRRKFLDTDTLPFGRCPRVLCEGQIVLPVGLSDIPRKYTVNMYCPRCCEIYHPSKLESSNLDGAYFGTTFPHLFLLQYPNLIPHQSGATRRRTYVPRIYGFRVNKTHPESPFFRATRSSSAASSIASNSSVDRLFSRGTGRRHIGGGSSSSSMVVKKSLYEGKDEQKNRF